MIRRLLAISLFVILVSTPGWSNDRSQNLREAISKIEIGRCNDAATFLEQVLARDDADPLGHMALGTAYLHTGKLAEAGTEFERVLSAVPNEWHARYALGLIAMMDNHPTDAESQFARLAAVPEAQSDLAALRGYLDFTTGKSFAVVSSTESSPLAAETAAMAALKAGRRDAARDTLIQVLRQPGPPGFAETRAPLPTFDPKQPVAVPGGKFIWKPIEKKDAHVVSGVITLKADANRLSEVSFVSLYVDDACVSVTNYSPFQFSWDTTTYSNGLHSIKIEAKGAGGGVISTKSVEVRIANDGVTTGSKISPEDADLVSRLWNCIRLGASRKLAHYNLAKIYIQAGDRETATKELESVVASDPYYLDARSLLNGLRGWGTQCVEAWRGKPGSKLVALSFDDGPNERTAEMLDMLAKLKVHATFFLVGFRAEAQPDLVKAMSAGGHEIENHTYTHTILTTLSADEVEVELSKNAAILHSLTGKDVRYFRPPGGHANAATKEAAARQGFTAIFWTVLCSPYEGAKYVNMADYVINNTCDGAIILMHNGEPATTSALPRIVNELRAKGYRFVTLSELLANGTAPPPPKQQSKG
jgi:peptidoglycan/xylan/chitin deacetylase (PgdA/CDA1 family)